MDTTKGDKHWMYLLLIFAAKVVTFCDSATVLKCTNEEFSLRCNENCQIEIATARYGHSGTICSYNPQHCTSNATQVFNRCSGEKQCSFYVDQQRPVQRCRQASAYIRVEYECKCEEKSCDLLDEPGHGKVVFSSPHLVLGTRAAYSCQPGYSLVGPQIRACSTGGEWNQFQPACVASDIQCPTSPYIVQAFDDRCYEFVPMAETFSKAVENCKQVNASLIVLRDFREVQFIRWQLEKTAAFGYTWVTYSRQFLHMASSPATQTEGEIDLNECHEFYKGEGKWVPRKSSSCSFLNQYICTHNIGEAGYTMIGQHPESEPADVSPNKETVLGLVVGVVVAVILVVVFLVLICCKRRWKLRQKEREARRSQGEVNNSVDTGHHQGELYEHELYDDAASVMAGTDEVTINIPVPPTSYNYSQVKKESKKGRNAGKKETRDEGGAGSDHQTYDDVYGNSNAPKPPAHQGPRYKTSSQNTYENVKVMNLVGSLKKKLKTGKLRHIDIGEGNDQQEKAKFAHGNGKSDRTLGQGKPVPAARNSMKKDSKNKVNIVKPARSGQPKPPRHEPSGLKNRVSSGEQEFVENELYDDRSPFDGFMYQRDYNN